MASEWTEYILGLQKGFIHLEELDVLKWTYNSHDGILTAKLAYQVLFEDEVVDSKWWFRSLWKWNILYEIILFIWLALENCIPTWDNICKRGMCGPNICTRSVVVVKNLCIIFLCPAILQNLCGFMFSRYAIFLLCGMESILLIAS